ncbi:outer membrane protein transport protein [Enterovibrio norvegicus]|uniref:Long-chain fatty acid transport protein n=1 Tax=Enterovibrio norvegicus DSM 15893 TaxID=1121869 RepID=A0A1I5MXG3_9GAMM|nr:outer membrane protein transport protein [Enterovibrio norvegicus]SFP14162.1 long-chain fatty acid transport protein [Enterovibrio norvegicus DSM 15893]
MSKKLSRTAIALAVALAAPSAWSAGFQVSEHSASGLGRAYAGDAAIADNASVIGRNPAQMTMFKEAQLSTALHIVDPEIDITDTSNNQKASDVAPMQFVPATYYVSPINDKWAWGVGLYTVYGVATDYPDAFEAGDVAGDTSLASVNLNPSIAYRLNEQVSFGAGINVVYAIAELNRHIGTLAPTFGSDNFSEKLISMEGDTWGFGWNVGALFELDKDNRFGIAYRSEVELDFSGDFTDHQGSITGTKGQVVTGDLSVPLPAVAELSGFHQLNPSLAVHYSMMWSQWSSFTELKATSAQCTSDGVKGVCFDKQEDYESVFRWSLGTTYDISEDWTVRTGFAFDEKAGKSTLSIPDSDRYWFSAGATYRYSPNLTFDAGVTYIASKSGTFTETSLTGERAFSAKGAAYIGAMQANYSF